LDLELRSRIFYGSEYKIKNFLQEKAVEATKQEKERKEEKMNIKCKPFFQATMLSRIFCQRWNTGGGAVIRKECGSPRE
jgi:hypothetical protein